MKTLSLAHLSDLHVGRSPETDARAARVLQWATQARLDHVVVTGDVTHRGRLGELERFFSYAAALDASGRLTVLPGNHDRMGDNAAGLLMEGERVRATTRPGLYLISVDSSAAHNRYGLASHGLIDFEVIGEVNAALALRPADHLCVLALHHHVTPLPEESWAESFATRVGWPYAEELKLGRELLQAVAGRCDLVLHGHRHVPRETLVDRTRVFNAGSSSELCAVRVFRHRLGILDGEPRWVAVPPPVQALPVTLAERLATTLGRLRRWPRLGRAS